MSDRLASGRLPVQTASTLQRVRIQASLLIEVLLTSCPAGPADASLWERAAIPAALEVFRLA